VRIDQRHRGEPAIIRATHDSDAPVVVRHVFNEPVDRVVGVGALVDRVRVAFVTRRTDHYELPFGLKLAADVLEDEGVTVSDELLEFEIRTSLVQSLTP